MKTAKSDRVLNLISNVIPNPKVRVNISCVGGEILKIQDRLVKLILRQRVISGQVRL